MTNDSKNIPWWIALIFTFGGILAFQRAGTPAGDSTAAVAHAESQPPASAAPPIDESSWLLPLETFLGYSRPAPASPAPSPGQFDETFVELLKRHVGKLDFLIATVADAKETQNNYRFDLQLDAIHKAVAAERMVLDGYYLPWEDTTEPAKARREPGVLLYRRTPSDSNNAVTRDLLLVFLVGEVPTTGIHKPAFREAVERIVRLREILPLEPDRQGTISVVGPIFTGSSDSLAISISQAAELRNNLKFRVITGSANVVNKQRFEDLAGHETTFHSTLINGTRMRTALIDYVTRNNFERTSIAWLAEASSGTGAESLRRVDDGAAANPSNAPAAAEKFDMYEFLFPLNIAKVRAVYSEKERREESSQPSLGPGRYRLAIPFGETATARDMPAMQTPQMTAPANEILISQMLNTIRQRRIKYVVISSIDGRDPIFLAEIVRRHCPDAQLMLVSPEIIHLHSEFRSVLHGALVASTHSLNPEDQTWCFPYGKAGSKKDRHRYSVMGSQSSYGIYNAVVFLRGLEKGALQLSDSNKITPVPESTQRFALPIAYGSPLENGNECVPPVWISRIGPTGFHPVATVPLKAEEGPELIRVTGISADPARPEFNGRMPFAARVCSICWLAAAVVYGLWRHRKSCEWAVAENENLWTRSYNALPQLFCASITATFVCMLALWGLLMVPPLLPASNIGRVGWLLDLLHLAASVLLALWFARILGGDLWHAIRSRPSPQTAPELAGQVGVLELVGYMRNVVLVLVATLVAGMAVVVCEQVWEFCDSHDRFLFWFASWMDIWNGISFLPALQFLAATVILLAYGMLRQVELLQETNVQQPPQAGNEPQRGSGDLWAQLLFPLLKRYEPLGVSLEKFRREGRWQSPAEVRNWVLPGACVIGVCAWLGYTMSQVPSVDFFSAQIPGIGFPLNAVPALFLVICAYWFLRFMKLLELMRSLLRNVEKPGRKLEWTKVFSEHKLVMPSLADLLLWPRWPEADAVNTTQEELDQLLAYPAEYTLRTQLATAREKLFLAQMQLYVRQLCFHCSRLLVGVVIGALLIFLAANSYPFHMQPLLRLTSSLILAAVAIAMTWFYIKLDRNPVISGIVGTAPHQVQFNWSLIQTLGPALGLTALAFLSQVFPDVWHWIRETIEPARRA